MARNTSCMAGAWPRISGVSDGPDSTLVSRRLSSSARRISSTALSISKGLARYSKAPPWNAATAESRSEKAVIMMTGKPGKRDLTVCSNSRPEAPGMRMSETSTCGVSSSSAAMASRALAKLLVARFSRARAFSSTQRIDSSSSTIQIGFISVCVPQWISWVGYSLAYGKGRTILKSVYPGRLSHSITPRCCCTKVCAKVSPSPLPPSLPDTSG